MRAHFQPTAHGELATWLVAANAGDAAAYRRLLEALVPLLRRAARRTCLRRGMTVDVERVVQQVLLAIHAKRQTWDTRQPLAAWVWAIARAALADVWLTSAESATPQVRPPL